MGKNKVDVELRPGDRIQIRARYELGDIHGVKVYEIVCREQGHIHVEEKE